MEESSNLLKGRRMAAKFTFRSNVQWIGEKKGQLSSEGKPDITISTPPEFKGFEGYWSPEELFISSINTCIMTTFLYFVEKFALEVSSYQSKVEGEVRLEGGKFVFSSVAVKPYITVKNESMREKTLHALKKSEKYCLVSSSVKPEVSVSPEIKVREE